MESALARDESRTQLVKLSVDPTQAQARVKSLSGQEDSVAAEHQLQLPAGGDGGIIDALVIIFVPLLINDLLGLTDVYPFVKKYR